MKKKIKPNQPWTRIKKTKEMAEVFKRKSGPINNRRKSRTKQKQEWQREQDDL